MGEKRPFLVRTVHRAVPHTGLLEKFLYSKMADRIITVCESARRKLIDHLGLAPTRVTTISGAVDTDRFSPANKGGLIKKELGLSLDIPVVGMAAPFQSYRKHRSLFEAIPRIKEAVPGTKFLLVGHGGSYQSVLKKLAQKLNIEDDLIYTSYRDRDFPQVLAVMDVKVFLAPGADGFCRAVLEAMATSKPVVAAPVGPIMDIARDKFPGFIVNPEDSASLAKAVSILLQDKTLAEGKGESGRKLVEKYFREDIRAERVEEVYASLLRRRRS
ncbi:glycosyltransferase family 4 protein [candidate division NPL-UPA2 bacterium]|nr:glycosyltransferase family 4 protein [candidate division NPL-UPA2 bacterium]